ncbi:uncharacterized protein LOC129742806, partial [Uranotaenia lowii]|uniref:uncharacterized protein LOC129742806 n=1 Tax=Uranotaenia lowii TaxID=190385 RepID=UPI00247ACA05
MSFKNSAPYQQSRNCFQPLEPPPSPSGFLSQYYPIDQSYYQTQQRYQNQQNHEQYMYKPTAKIKPLGSGSGTIQYNATAPPTTYNSMAPPSFYDTAKSYSEPSYTFPYTSLNLGTNHHMGFSSKPNQTKEKRIDKKSYDRMTPWVKQDSLKTPAPLCDGKGLNMLQRMGWNPGQGLGKKLNGSLEPLLPNIKMDKKGFDVQKKPVKLRVFSQTSGKRPPKPT